MQLRILLHEEGDHDLEALGADDEAHGDQEVEQEVEGEEGFEGEEGQGVREAVEEVGMGGRVRKELRGEAEVEETFQEDEQDEDTELYDHGQVHDSLGS